MVIQVEGIDDGPPVVMVHGLGGSSSVWWPQAIRLRSTCRLILPDLPGSGRSPLDGPLSIDTLVDGLLRLLDAEGLGAAAFVGHSFGTLILQHLAANHPDRVARLALVGPVRAPTEQARTAIRQRAAMVRSDGMAPLATQLLSSALSAHTREHAPVAVAFVRETLLAQSAEGYAATCDALAAADDAAWDKIVAPTLILAGEQDAARPIAEVLTSKIAGANLRIVADSGHWLTVEQPEAVSDQLAAFLASVDEMEISA